MNYILFDDNSRGNLLPLTFTRPIAEIRIGIITLREKWEHYVKSKISYKTEKYLSLKFPIQIKKINCFINASIIPTQKLIEKIKLLNENEVLIQDNIFIATVLNEANAMQFDTSDIKNYNKIEFKEKILKIDFPWQIFALNGEAIEQDFQLITEGRKSEKLSSTNNLLGEHKIFVEEGVKAEFVTINATTGSVYIGKDSEIMEGSVIRGPFAICEHSSLKLLTKIYGPTTIGPHSKVGGEINNSVIFGYSNKAHDGFLGNSVIGEWCNIGADSNNSNLKNNYALVRLWNYTSNNFVKTDLQFCGLIMGDHSKCGINTMFNTGTVVGVNANIYGSGFPRNFIPDFSWGGASGFTEFDMKKAIEVAQTVMSRRNVDLTDKDIEILQYIFDYTEQYRKF
ncbi:MAG TPA: glucose-1-phosphate thymidylyltransferase [Bacteroidales bacterium]|nr:MAG: glucose-1-phosphate thymidylyltransferase [Bacteroidetes bacterium GWF2_33_38]OFY68692.1 MAG: glucose-1-phosphate thymidylyltransferase [Bacteroidetes bacterium RIFOXYA12_FULL_33_9]OFY88150.1 MAG: glucose-1-phosphate thymidylyltransferase [Bacteroidetes bacterium RIFOXYA2_FULL_33_7]HBF89143.1 glucose-1-phosphate thymidylyltransferase [Bacteroidales bacterium]